MKKIIIKNESKKDRENEIKKEYKRSLFLHAWHYIYDGPEGDPSGPCL